MVDSAREALSSFVTAEWIELAPDLVRGLEVGLRQLAPGMSVGEKYASLGSVPLPSQLPRAEPIAQSASQSSTASSASLVLSIAPSASQSSAVSSPVVAPPMSTTPSTDSGASGSLHRDSDVEVTARPSRPFPRKSSRKARIVSPPTDTASSTATVAPPIVPVIALPGPPTQAEASAAPSSTPAASTRLAKKRSATEASLGDGSPASWKPCTNCRSQKKGCVASPDAIPPYSACVLCVRSKKVCERAVSGASAFSVAFVFSDFFLS